MAYISYVNTKYKNIVKIKFSFLSIDKLNISADSDISASFLK